MPVKAARGAFVQKLEQPIDKKAPVSSPLIRDKHRKLLWYWREAWQSLMGMLQGAKFPELTCEEFAEPLAKDLRNLTVEHVPATEDELRKIWKLSFAKQGIAEAEPYPAEPKLLEALRKAKTTRRVRTIVKQSKWLTPDYRDGAGAFIWENPETFLSLKSDPRIPRSSRPSTDEKWIAVISRRLAAVRAGYKPRSGERIRDISEFLGYRCACGRPAVLGLRRGREIQAWCGLC